MLDTRYSSGSIRKHYYIHQASDSTSMSMQDTTHHVSAKTMSTSTRSEQRPLHVQRRVYLTPPHREQQRSTEYPVDLSLPSFDHHHDACSNTTERMSCHGRYVDVHDRRTSTRPEHEIPFLPSLTLPSDDDDDVRLGPRFERFDEFDY